MTTLLLKSTTAQIQSLIQKHMDAMDEIIQGCDIKPMSQNWLTHHYEQILSLNRLVPLAPSWSEKGAPAFVVVAADIKAQSEAWEEKVYGRKA